MTRTDRLNEIKAELGEIADHSTAALINDLRTLIGEAETLADMKTAHQGIRDEARRFVISATAHVQSFQRIQLMRTA